MYKQLLQRLQTDSTDKYSIYLDHKLDILRKVTKYGQVAVSKELGISQASLSSLVKVMTSMVDKEHRRYRLYYVKFNNICKIGVTSDISSRLAHMKGATSIESWSMTKDVARLAEKYIKDRYKVHSLGTKYTRGGGGSIVIPDEDRPLYNDVDWAILSSCNEVFTGDILTIEDRAYLLAISEEVE